MQKSKGCITKIKSPELWLFIIEKVWAKVHGNYDRIELGLPHRVFRDLTGAPSYVHMIPNEEREIFDIITEVQLPYFTSCGTNSTCQLKHLKESFEIQTLYFYHS